jgi:hypothetical protein
MLRSLFVIVVLLAVLAGCRPAQTYIGPNGSFEIPGRAYIHPGHLVDDEGQPMNKSLALHASPNMKSREVCLAGMGAAVQLRDVARATDGMWVQVRADNCQGWLPVTFISKERYGE